MRHQASMLKLTPFLLGTNSLEAVMSKHSTISLAIAIATASVISMRPAGAQSPPRSGVYEILAGNYTECCGKGGVVTSTLPNASQGFVRLAPATDRDFATMTFLGSDARTVFSIVPCPGGKPISFEFDHGFAFSERIIFHADPGPPPYSLYWSYMVSNRPASLRIDGVQGTARQDCVDVPTQFRHSNVVAVLVPGPRMRISEISKEKGTLLFIQGNAGWTNVVEASQDLVSWSGISTNFMPFTLCPICPFILVRDTESTNQPHRFYRSFEFR
jgi:hypothetical protein